MKAVAEGGEERGAPDGRGGPRRRWPWGGKGRVAWRGAGGALKAVAEGVGGFKRASKAVAEGGLEAGCIPRGGAGIGGSGRGGERLWLVAGD